MNCIQLHFYVTNTMEWSGVSECHVHVTNISNEQFVNTHKYYKDYNTI